MTSKSKFYRFWEMLPGLFAWTTIFFPLWGSFVVPRLVAYFVIAFLIYWLYQSFKSIIFAFIGYYKIQSFKQINWLAKFNSDFRSDWLKYRRIEHCVIIASAKEPLEVIDIAVSSLAAQEQINLKKLHLLVALEERAGLDHQRQVISYFTRKYKDVFGHLLFPVHPNNIPGETAGKHSNERWAAIWFKKNYLDLIENFTLTSCDVDTLFHPHYFAALTYFFAADPKRYLKFWQSPIFWHHNIDAVPAPIRIIGTLGNIIHIANIQEPDGLFFNYSCYSSSYQLINDAGYWDVDMIPEDWHIFLQAFFTHQGKVSVNPIFLPTLVDAPSGRNYFTALKNRYRQCLRHAWGAIDLAYAIEQSRLHPEIPLIARLLRIFKLIEAHFVWSTNWFILTLGTSLPALLNPNFFQTAIGFNLPRISNIILTLCLIPLFFIIVLDWRLRPATSKKGLKAFLLNLLQWPLMPLATLTMSVLPGLHSHTRLMLGKSLEYQPTAKH